jgi:hypothetical protein
LAALFGLATTAVQANGIAALVQPQSGSPVTVVGCNGSLEYVNSGYGTSFYRLVTNAEFKNTSAKTAVAVLIRFQLENAFGDVLGQIFGQSSGQFSSGIEIDGQKWTGTYIWPGLSVIRCSVNRVLFSDGTTWKDSNASPPSS